MKLLVPIRLSLTTTAQAQVTAKGRILDLNADKGVEVEDGDRVAKWTNQVTSFAARDFLKRDEGRKDPILSQMPAIASPHSSVPINGRTPSMRKWTRCCVLPS